ncbi:TonB-dependent receptor [Vibrio coralliilyticus]|uniref:TonB-dependent receptor n=1 Tax=Vibrio coralliilyticus TaxID=190893 RepID=A0A837G2K3_9VIBR|nr:TonB-dependent hemoglobin/transferrin/lactoferrin family receptor [Vibrio coralliilyticus]KJY72577.1 TonB-dependent receptor [Vibrio coralliilyticus]QOU31560.1 TonB-dependent hemoglobin/transferrin/lactoferrin family receptor [Vibrio coralliilyticus]
MYKKSLLSASIVLALAPSVHAEEYALFDEVVVSASRTEQQLEDVAGSVSVVTDKQIDKNLASNVDDVLKYTPGVDVISDGRMGIQQINIRGMEGNRVNILVDGVAQPYLYDQSYTFISSGRIALDTDMIKAVEIVKGSASSLYGSDGIGGIVAFQTKDPSDFLGEGDGFGGQVKLGFASRNDSFTENVVLANRSGDLETLVAYTRNDAGLTDNFANGDYQDYSPKDLDSKADNVLAKVQYQIDTANRIEFTGEFINENSKGDIQHSSFPTFNSDDTTERSRLSLKHIWEGSTKLADSVTSQVTWLSHEQNNVTDRVGTSFGSAVNEIKDYSYEDKGIQADLQVNKYLSLESSEHFFTYGLAYTNKDITNYNKIIDRSNNDQTSVYFYQPDATETRIGLFVQDQISLLEDKLVVTPGLRWDRFETKPDSSTEGIPSGQTYETNTSSALTARLGTVYSLDDESKVFAQVSQGHRAPTFEELYYSMPGHGYTNVPNPNLEAEESITYETGYRYTNDFSRSEIAVFYSDYKNFIDVVDISSGSSEYQHQNVGKATIKGIEFSSRIAISEVFELPKGISTNFAASYTEGEDGENKPLNSVNPWNAVASLDYDAPSQTWGTSIAMNYYAEKKLSDINVDPDNSTRTPDEVGTPSATVIDLTAYYRPIQDLTLRAGLFNITDKEYWKWSDVRGEGALHADDTQAGRNWAITAKYEF